MGLCDLGSGVKVGDATEGDVIKGKTFMNSEGAHTGSFAHTETLNVKASGTVDMGEQHHYRYAVPYHDETIDVSANGTTDMGSQHAKRYVNSAPAWSAGYSAGRTPKTLGTYTGSQTIDISGIEDYANRVYFVTGLSWNETTVWNAGGSATNELTRGVLAGNMTITVSGSNLVVSANGAQEYDSKFGAGPSAPFTYTIKYV